MNRKFTRRLHVAAIAVMLSSVAMPAMAQTAQQAQQNQQQRSQQASQIIQNWPDVSQKAANSMIQKYGQPEITSDQMLVWFDNGPWKQTTVYREPEDHNFPMPHQDVLEQTINHEVPEDKFDELARYDGSVVAKRTFGELAARCDNEAANFVAINLANDIITGQRNVEEARQQYAQIMQQVMDGEMPPYAQGFQFDVAQQDLNFPDESIMETVTTGSR